MGIEDRDRVKKKHVTKKGAKKCKIVKKWMIIY